ncbi:MAG TPA: carboxymuconolactone decarboxylase family protein [Caulobacteraceae bacterium]|jgi:alkylhydroperoxidase family enzyme|nr:carboxymuconolactone decarboxylase family protein [Caulobacteraceae bacterium]
MRLAAPRIAPVDMDQLSPEAAEALKPFEGRPVLNIFRTFARAPKALTAFLAWGNYVLSRRNSLPTREREIVILRVGYLCRSGYEFAQHRRIGLDAGLSEAEIAAIKAGADASGWSAADRALIRATDELHQIQFISEPTWAELSHHFDEKQRMDLVFTAAQYTQVSMVLNTFGVQLENSAHLDPDLRA